VQQLHGKIALVTGGGRGIGRGVVDRFLAEGASVAIVQRTSLNDALNSHPQVAHVEPDLSVLSSVGTVAEHVVERFGGIDVLVNNAGIMVERPVAEILPRSGSSPSPSTCVWDSRSRPGPVTSGDLGRA